MSAHKPDVLSTDDAGAEAAFTKLVHTLGAEVVRSLLTHADEEIDAGGRGIFFEPTAQLNVGMAIVDDGVDFKVDDMGPLHIDRPHADELVATIADAA